MSLILLCSLMCPSNRLSASLDCAAWVSCRNIYYPDNTWLIWLNGPTSYGGIYIVQGLKNIESKHTVGTISQVCGYIDCTQSMSIYLLQRCTVIACPTEWSTDRGVGDSPKYQKFPSFLDLSIPSQFPHLGVERALHLLYGPRSIYSKWSWARQNFFLIRWTIRQ